MSTHKTIVSGRIARFQTDHESKRIISDQEKRQDIRQIIRIADPTKRA